MKYMPFRMMYPMVLKQLKRAGAPVKDNDVCSMWYHSCQVEPEGKGSIKHWMASAEYHWRYPNQRHALFPESLELCERLMRAKFEVGKGATLDFPYEVFALFMPKGFRLAGAQTTSCLVQFMSYGDRQTQLNCLQLDSQLDLVTFEGNDLPLDTMCMNVHYPSPFNDKMRESFVVPVDKVMEYLELDDGRAFARVLGHLGRDGDTLTIETSDHEAEYQQQLLKFIVTMMVYVSARGEDALTNGVPCAIPNQATDKGVAVKGITLSDQKTDRLMAASHIRAMHFRNLRHEKYYKGEHEKKPQGSRWSLVKESVIGERMKTKTIR